MGPESKALRAQGRLTLPSFTIRKLNASDVPFLREMIVEAAQWRPGSKRVPLEEALADPELNKWVADWGRDGDAGVLAESSGEPIGAAWFRHWTADCHSYGYVGPDVPELAIGVRPAWRGRGVGGELLAELADVARDFEVTRLSLSVEKDNPAFRLYLRSGYREVGENGNAWTMVRKLNRERD